MTSHPSSHHRSRPQWINRWSTRIAALAVLGLLLLLPIQAWGEEATPDQLAEIYARMENLDGYEFTSTVEQTTVPLPLVTNIGLSSRSESLLVTGSIDKPGDQMLLTFLEQSGHMLDGTGQVELKIENGQVWGRPNGGEWETVDESSRPDLNSAEPAAYLQATRNVRFLGVDERGGVSFDVYAFEVDGPTWAELMRVALEEDMKRRGELVLNQSLDALDYYAEMTAEGEVWVNAAGLPQRVIFHVVYPPLEDETVYREVRITSDYSQWQEADTSPIAQVQTGLDRLATDMAGVPAGSSDWAAGALGRLGLPLLLILLALTVIRYRRSMAMRRGIAIGIIAIFVLEPALSAITVQAAGERRTSRVETQKVERAESTKVDAAVEKIKQDLEGNFSVDQGLFAQRAAESLAAGVADSLAPEGEPGLLFAAEVTAENDQDGDGLPDSLEKTLGTDPTKKDSDGDKLDDYTEYYTLGLNPADPDSDGDLLSDGFETTGIQMGGKTWYLNPLNRDSNNDGQADSIECLQAVDVVVSASGKGTKIDPKGTGVCDDSDGDGTPDFADDDNDNDGVWDWLDGQPTARFGDLAKGVKDGTFAYNVSNYSSGKPLRLSFEMRPTNAQHLWYSRNVLDWPSGDYEGQIRRIHDTTIGTSGAEANGDMQLVPMIEVTVPGAEAIHLPTIAGKTPVVGDNAKLAEWLDMDVLQRYQMAVSWTQDKQSLRVYMPATLVRDTKTNAPLYFAGKLLYWPNGTGLFSTDHTARLVWMVNLDTDSCAVPDGNNYKDSCLPDGSNYNNGIHWKTTKQQIVHRYYDSFYLSSFTAEEDLGANAQIFYENPSLIPNKAAYVPDQLLGLGSIMELYLRQKKSPEQALQEFKAKKPNATNRLVASSLIQDPDTYGMMAKVATEQAPALLDSIFAPHRNDLTYPTMLYVTWGKSKVNGLTGISSSDRLTMTMTQGVVKAATNVRVGSFTYNPNPATVGGKQNPNWSAVNPGTVWTQQMQGQSTKAYEQLPQTTRQKIDVDKFQQSALSLYWNLARGVNINTDFESALSERSDAANGFVDELGAALDNGGNNAIAAMIDVVNDFKEAQEDLAKLTKVKAGTALLAKLQGKDIKNLADVDGAISASKWAKGLGTTAVTFAGLSATVSLVLAFKDQLGLSEGAVTALEAVNATIGLALAGLQIAQEISKVVQAAKQSVDGLRGALAFSSEVGKVGAWAAAIVAVLIVAVAVYMLLSLGANTVAGRTAFAQGITTAVVTIILFVLGLFFPIGTAIGLLIGLIDGIFTAICKIANWVGGKDADGKTFEDRNSTFCNGIVGNTIAEIAGFFYTAKPMVDMSYAERLKFGQTDTRLIEQNGLLGMSEGNKLEVKQPVTTTVRIPDDHYVNKYPIKVKKIDTGQVLEKPGYMWIAQKIASDMPLAEYDRLIKQKTIFRYELVAGEDTPENDSLKTTTPDAWKSVKDGDDRNRLTKGETATTQVTLAPGINYTPSLHVREYYTFYMAECSVLGCDTELDEFDKKETGKREVMNLGKNLIYDIFPSTLTGFYTLAQVQEGGQFVNRYRLAWGGKGKPFPTLVDADGDGLRSDGTGTLDPDDKSGDTDLDGVPDTVEVQDFRLNPKAADSDNDGLNDYLELRYGTRPDRSDSDGDGLTDSDEINGWSFTYVNADQATVTTWVTSNPLVFDTDGDGFSDGQERIFGFHPRAKTREASILSLTTSTNQSNSTFLAPAQSINFTSTVKNELREPIAYGLLEAEILNSGSAIAPVTFELKPQASTQIQGAISVPAASSSALTDTITLRNRAGANMVDPNASYASQLKGLASADGLKFLLTFEERPSNAASFNDATGKVRLTCAAGESCPSQMVAANSYARFDSRNWYLASGSELAFSQARFSVGGFVTPRRAFGDEYTERYLLGNANLKDATSNYLQLSLVNLNGTPQAKISFTATDGAQCEQVFTNLSVNYEQKTHVFVTYDGTLVRGYKNGELVGSYNLQNCANKVPAGNSFTVGRGASHATLYISNVYYSSIDEGWGWGRSAEPYILIDNSTSPLWSTSGVKDGHTRTVDKKQAVDVNSSHTIYLCEEDSGDKQGKCDSDSSRDSDDKLGEVTFSPSVNMEYNTSWNGPDGRGQLRYNVQNNFFHGDLDDLRIYEKSLDAREVGQLVSGGSLTYQLDEASGRTEFRNAGTDTTQLTCAAAGNCPTSGVKGYSGQAVSFTGAEGQGLSIASLRQRFGSSFLVSFWLKPEQGKSTSSPVPLIRSGQNSEGYAVYATSDGSRTALNSRYLYFSTSLGAIGGSGGNFYGLACNRDEAMVGLYGGAGSLVDRVGLLCVTINAAGQWVGSPRQAGSAGGGGGNSYERRCPENWAVTGFSGRSGGLVDQITLECGQLSADGYANSLNASNQSPIGGGGGNAQDRRVCPSNLPAHGIYGRAGGLVDSFGIMCRNWFTGNASLTVPNGQWTHVALAQSGETLYLYINGQLAQTIWFGPAGLRQYRLTGSYSPDLFLGGGLAGLMDEIQIAGLSGSSTSEITSQVAGVYNGSATVYLPLDETTGSTTFVNSTGKGNLTCADANNCAQAGVKGQVRESVLFNGPANAPSLTITDKRHEPFSFSGWVKLTTLPTGTSSVVALHENAGQSTPNWRLSIANRNGRAVPVFSGKYSSNGETCTTDFSIPAQDSSNQDIGLALNQWHHLGINYDPTNGRNDLSFYLNGKLVNQQRVSSLICRTGTTLRMGEGFKGQVDEFILYHKPLPVTEFLSQYVYQSTWYDVVTNENFRVDFTAPTVRVTANPFVKPGTHIFGVAASDAESGIRTVEYKDTDGTWKTARTEAATSGVWAISLDVQSNTTVEVRATDNVGNVRTDSKSVGADNTPPTMALTTSGIQKTLTLNGTASDSGSGLQSATIMLVDPRGQNMNSPRDLAVTNGNWSYTQELPPMVNGTFRVWTSAVDQLGNRFEGYIGTVQVDNAGPVPGMMVERQSLAGIQSNLPVVRGYVTDQPYPTNMKLFLGFEDQPTSGSITRTLDMSSQNLSGVPATGATAPTVALDGSNRRANFQAGQALVITQTVAQATGPLFTLPANNATIAMWINPTSTAPAEQMLLGQAGDSGYSLLLKGDQLTLRINRSGGPMDKDTGQRVTAGQWQMVVVTVQRTGASAQQITAWVNTAGGNAAGKSVNLASNELLALSAAPVTVSAASNGFVGKLDDVVVYGRALNDLEVRQLTQSTPSPVQKVEVGLLHRKDLADPTKVVWQDATLSASNASAATWQVQIPAGLEGMYDISLRTSDSAGNQRVLGGVWNGVIDTNAPTITLAGTTPGSHQCTVTDFSLGTDTFLCADAKTAGAATQADFAAGSLAAASLTWDAQWWKNLYTGRTKAPARLYALFQGGRTFLAPDNTADSCDIYGNCTRCTVSNGDPATAQCSAYVKATSLRGPLGSLAVANDDLTDVEVLGPETFTTTVIYERPDAYVPGEEPASATSTWVIIDEPNIVIDDAILASTRPFAASFTQATAVIEWGESVSATQYYAGWTLTETVVITDLTAYAGPDEHVQTLADQGRYYAHVVAVDAEGEDRSFTLGPIYFDGAVPASYLNWDEYGPGQPYRLWQDALSPTGQVCNLLGVEDRAAIYTNNTSPRGTTQYLYGTWNDEWLAIHWDGVDLGVYGDMHLYLDTKAGGGIYAYDPYGSIDQAQGLVVMPERRQFQSNSVDRMLADFAVIVEDASTVRLLTWNGSTWQDMDTGQMRFRHQGDETILWLPLSLLGVNPSAVDVSMLGFVTEEDAMQVWATMPANNPLNSPAMQPEHAEPAISVDSALVNMRNAMRLSSDPAVNNSLDNCPTNVVFDDSLLDIRFGADPAGEVYDPVLYEGVRAVVSDDVEAVLASLCAGVSDTSNSPVCELAKQVADNAGGGGPEAGPNGLYPATAGPNSALTFYATVRNLSNQATGDITLEVESGLPINGSTLNVGMLDVGESKVVSFTQTVDPAASYIFSEVTIYPVEKVENSEESIILTYEHPPHTVIHDIDRAAPFSATLLTETTNDRIGVGEQFLTGEVGDQSLVTQIVLNTSLGETVNCTDTVQISAFASDWVCAINIPEDTPSGTTVEVTLSSATDEYGFSSGALATWSFVVDNTPPEVTLLDDQTLRAVQLQQSTGVTETLFLDGMAGDDQLLDAVQVCDTLQGFRTCRDAELAFFTDVFSRTQRNATFAAALADEAYWFIETELPQGIENQVVPYSIVAFDAFGNGTELGVELEIDTLPPTITLSGPPATQMDYDGSFALTGNVEDKGTISDMFMEVVTPQGEYEVYTVTLATTGTMSSGWSYSLVPDSTQFAAPGEYSYTLLAYDGFGNEGASQVYTLAVLPPPTPLLNDPTFVTPSDDAANALWNGFAPGAQLYTLVYFDDLDLSLGDVITVTADPLPHWLTLNQLDERSFEITGTVPLTITQIDIGQTITDTGTITDTDPITDDFTLQINVGVQLEDSTGRQAFQFWSYDVNRELYRFYFPFIFKNGNGLANP